MADPIGTPTPLFAGKGDLFDRICQVRESFLRSGGTGVQADRNTVTPTVMESWQRSLRYGLDPGRVAPVHRPEVELDSHLTRVTEAIVAKRDAVLDQSMSGISLTDSEGNLLRQWVHDETLGRWLETHDIVPSFSVDETVIGTTSGICLLSGEPAMVRGPEHFSEAYFGGRAYRPSRYPRIIGSLHLTCRYQDTSPVLLSWVMELAEDVQRVLHDSATRRERILLNGSPRLN